MTNKRLHVLSLPHKVECPIQHLCLLWFEHDPVLAFSCFLNSVTQLQKQFTHIGMIHRNVKESGSSIDRGSLHLEDRHGSISVLVNLHRIFVFAIFNIVIDSNYLKEITRINQNFNMFCLKFIDLYLGTPLQYQVKKRKHPSVLFLKNRHICVF